MPAMTFLAEEVAASSIASTVGGTMVGPNATVRGVGTYASALPNSLSFQLQPGGVTDEVERVVLCTAAVAESVGGSTKILVADARAAFMRFLAQATADWDRTVTDQAEKLGIDRGRHHAHPSAVIEPGTVIGAGVVIEPNAVVRQGTVIGPDSTVSAGAIIGAHGPALHRCADGTVLSWVRLHFGTVQIGARCEIGANAVLLRAMLGRTRIGADVVVGNLVHIGHGADIGNRVWLAAGVTVCGHARLGDNASVGAGATIRDNVDVARGANVGMGSVVTSPVGEGKSVIGVPARETDRALRSAPDR